MEARIRTYLEILIPASEGIDRVVAGIGTDGVHSNRRSRFIAATAPTVRLRQQRPFLASFPMYEEIRSEKG